MSNNEAKISPKEDMGSLLGVNLETMVRETLPNMDSRDVEEIFKGVLTDDSQESQESSVSFVNSVSGSSSYNPQRQQLPSPMEYPSPYHTEYSGYDLYYKCIFYGIVFIKCFFFSEVHN